MIRAMSFARSTLATIPAALCSVALALGVASCGGKSGASSAETKATAPGTKRAGGTAPGPRAAPVNSKQFIARADEICRRANAGIGRSEAKLKGKRHKPDAHAAVVTRNQEIEEEAIKELAKLSPSADLAAAWRKMSLYRQALARQLGVFATATRLRATNLAPLVASKKKLHAELLKVGSKAGFKDCATLG